MKIAILGQTGYLGKKLSRRLINDGHDVLCLKMAKESIPKDLKGEMIFNYCDIDNIDNLDYPFDCLINLCCRYQKKGISDFDIFDSNLITPLKVFTRFLELGIKKHITIDTSLPKELNTYCLAKKEYSDILKWYTKKNNYLHVINVLLENFYGPDEPKDRFIPSTIEKMKAGKEVLLTEGDQKRDWIFVDDVIDNLSKMVTLDTSEQYVDFPLGSGEWVEVRKVIEYLAKLTKSESELMFGAIPKRENEPDTIADTTMMKKYGLSVKYDWLEGFKKMV